MCPSFSDFVQSFWSRDPRIACAYNCKRGVFDRATVKFAEYSCKAINVAFIKRSFANSILLEVKPNLLGENPVGRAQT
jgi:hypothetical protein